LDRKEAATSLRCRSLSFDDCVSAEADHVLD
jgi:hypothetical protein